MKTLYLECAMGASSDMLAAALFDLCPDRDLAYLQLTHLGYPGLHLELAPAEKMGIAGASFSLWLDQPPQGHFHADLAWVEELLLSLDMPRAAREKAMAVYGRIAQAEGAVHGAGPREVHFHEVGSPRAVLSVAACCLLWNLLSPDRVVVSPIHLGSGVVQCAHGLLPVPAPATARLLEGVPVYGGQIEGELCTPTGAALLREMAGSFGPMPVMAVEKTGCGIGKKDFPRPNCLRAFLGREEEAFQSNGAALELVCNLDDITSEALSFACQKLLEAGAVDVAVTPILMKKGRPAFQLTCMGREATREALVKALFQYTTTLGIRERRCPRYTLDSRFEEVSTPYGPVTLKISEGYGVKRCKPEYDTVEAAARKAGVPFQTVWEAAQAAARDR